MKQIWFFVVRQFVVLQGRHRCTHTFCHWGWRKIFWFPLWFLQQVCRLFLEEDFLHRLQAHSLLVNRSYVVEARSKEGTTHTNSWLARVSFTIYNYPWKSNRNSYYYQSSIEADHVFWRDGRVVECDCLENSCPFTGTVGSNPSLSAIIFVL